MGWGTTLLRREAGGYDVRSVSRQTTGEDAQEAVADEAQLDDAGQRGCRSDNFVMVGPVVHALDPERVGGVCLGHWHESEQAERENQRYGGTRASAAEKATAARLADEPVQAISMTGRSARRLSSNPIHWGTTSES